MTEVTNHLNHGTWECKYHTLRKNVERLTPPGEH